jgi:hypothetical protein
MMPRRKPALYFQAAAFALLASVLFVLAMAANPALHERLHHHESEETHEGCVVDLFAAGSVDNAIAPTLDLIFAAAASPVLAVATADVVSIFLAGSTLEHAPPARA